jgi:D-3-phosphoglycerate dehydrogenase / 2-oxoglutarate reductase
VNKVFIAEKFSVDARAFLMASPHIQITETLNEAVGLIIRSRTKISADYLDQAPNVKVIITSTSGFDHIDLVETQKRKLTVMFTPDANATSAAEHTWALLLSLLRFVPAADKSLRSGQWVRENFNGFELAGKTLGIVGLGRIGQKVARYAKAFGMDVIVFDPYQDDALFKELNLYRSSYEEVLKSADILTFHVPLTKETKNMFNQNHADYVSEKTVVINASRGGVVNELDLVAMLEQNKIAAAAIDVFEKEPLPRDSKLFKAPRLILTPHLGALTTEAFEKSSMEAAQLMVNFFISNAVRNPLPLVNNWGTLSFDN